MLTKTWSSAIQGLDAFTVEVEVNASGAGNDRIISIVGMPDTAVRESRERVWSAMCCTGFFPPEGRTTVNLAPADIRKEGAAFDLPIALGMIAATNGFDREALAESMVVGELALDGTVRPVRGVLPVALHALQKGIPNLIVPAENAGEAAVAQGINVFGIRHLRQAVEFLRGDSAPTPLRIDIADLYRSQSENDLDFADVKGQESARRALEVAAAGGHNVLMIGPPGSGKSMLARRLPSILPAMTLEEALETTRIHSIAGVLSAGQSLILKRPFRAPHHTVSDAGLLGGQSNPRPGEISLAHRGVLFLDELPEFKRHVLEVLRQPLESGSVTISRATGAFTFPAAFMMVAAMNPCPCGHRGGRQRQCRCGYSQVQRYRSRISGPLLDRIDIHVEVAPIHQEQMLAKRQGENSATIRQRVEKARKIQQQRYLGSGAYCNAQMTPTQMEEHCRLSKESMTLMRYAINEMNLSARAYDRILRLGRTMADLDHARDLQPQHITEAIQYRSLDRQMW